MHLNGLLNEFTARKEQISTANVLRAGRQRAHNIAAQLSRKGAMAAAAEWCNESVHTLINLAYETDSTGYCNIDPVTGVFERFAMPWGRYYRRYGLRATERQVLALHVNQLQTLRRPAPLWTYDELSKRWACNIFDYPQIEDALRYWKIVELDANTYKALLQSVQNRRT
jgi:hypothetical protein